MRQVLSRRVFLKRVWPSPSIIYVVGRPAEKQPVSIGQHEISANCFGGPIFRLVALDG